jgi:2-dehydropantoate 2-reductase
MDDPILVWGGGAIGGTLAASWAKAGEDVVLVDVVSEHIKACNTSGLQIEGPVEAFKVNIKAFLPKDLVGRFSRIVLAVKAQHTRLATNMLLSHLDKDGYVLSAQNGLNEIVISEIVGRNRTMGAFLNFGADWLGPGKILFGNRGAVVLGELDGSVSYRTNAMYKVMQKFDSDAVLTDNIWGYLWGKLAYGAMLFATALTDRSMADNFAKTELAPIWSGLAREVMAVARKRSIVPVGFDGFDPSAFLPDSDHFAADRCIAGLVDFNRKTAKTHSGIWRDLAVRRRKTEVDDQIGILIMLAKESGIEVPLIECLVSLVHDVEEGRRPLADETLMPLIDTIKGRIT